MVFLVLLLVAISREAATSIPRSKLVVHRGNSCSCTMNRILQLLPKQKRCGLSSIYRVQLGCSVAWLTRWPQHYQQLHDLLPEGVGIDGISREDNVERGREILVYKLFSGHMERRSKCQLESKEKLFKLLSIEDAIVTFKVTSLQNRFWDVILIQSSTIS